MAVSWWVATGISRKEEDYLREHHTSPVFKILQGCYWTHEHAPHVRGEETPLKMEYLLLSFITLGLGMLLSTISFLIELMYKRYEKRPLRQVVNKVDDDVIAVKLGWT